MSKQIKDERSGYYDISKKIQKQDLDITDWLDWFFNCLLRATHGAETTLDSRQPKSYSWLSAVLQHGVEIDVYARAMKKWRFPAIQLASNFPSIAAR